MVRVVALGTPTENEYQSFLERCPAIEKTLVDDGVILIKYWLHIGDEEQEERFRQRNTDPRRRWKLSPMDLEARARWVDYSRARDAMLAHTDTEWAPWYPVDATDKRSARLNVINHLLGQIPYEDLTPPALELPPRQPADGYRAPPIDQFNVVPRVFGGD